MNGKVLLVTTSALALGVLAGATIHHARAGGDDDLHRVAVATESIAKHLESIDRRLERIADRGR